MVSLNIVVNTESGSLFQKNNLSEGHFYWQHLKFDSLKLSHPGKFNMDKDGLPVEICL